MQSSRSLVGRSIQFSSEEVESIEPSLLVACMRVYMYSPGNGHLLVIELGLEGAHGGLEGGDRHGDSW